MAVHASASYKEIAATLRDRRVSAFPVLDDAGTVIGVVSEADLMAKEALEAGYETNPGPLSGLLHRRDLEKARGATAGELMSRPPVTVRPDDLGHLEGVAAVRDRLNHPAPAEYVPLSGPLF